MSWRGARSRATEPFPSLRLRQAHQPQLWQMAQGRAAVPDRECMLHDAACFITPVCGTLPLGCVDTNFESLSKLSVSRVLTGRYLASVLGSAALQPSQLLLMQKAVVSLACAASQGKCPSLPKWLAIRLAVRLQAHRAKPGPLTSVVALQGWWHISEGSGRHLRAWGRSCLRCTLREVSQAASQNRVCCVA